MLFLVQHFRFFIESVLHHARFGTNSQRVPFRTTQASAKTRQKKKKHQRTTAKKEHKRSKQSTKQFCSFVVVVVEAPNPKRNVPNSTVTTAHFRCGRIQFFQCFLLFQMLW
jgi:hypothetical protein